jgi:hypothetical protein
MSVCFGGLVWIVLLFNQKNIKETFITKFKFMKKMTLPSSDSSQEHLEPL